MGAVSALRCWKLLTSAGGILSCNFEFLCDAHCIFEKIDVTPHVPCGRSNSGGGVVIALGDMSPARSLGFGCAPIPQTLSACSTIDYWGDSCGVVCTIYTHTETAAFQTLARALRKKTVNNYCTLLISSTKIPWNNMCAHIYANVCQRWVYIDIARAPFNPFALIAL